MSTSRYPGWLGLVFWYVMRPRALLNFQKGLDESDKVRLRRVTAWLASLALYAPVALIALGAAFMNPELAAERSLRTGSDSVFRILARLFLENTILAALVLLLAFTCLTILTYNAFVLPERAAGLLMLVVLLGSSLLFLNIGPLLGQHLSGGEPPGVALGLELGLPVALSLILSSGLSLHANLRNVFYGVTLAVLVMAPIAGLPVPAGTAMSDPYTSTPAFLLTFSGIIAIGFALYWRNKRVLEDQTAPLVSKQINST